MRERKELGLGKTLAALSHIVLHSTELLPVANTSQQASAVVVEDKDQALGRRLLNTWSCTVSPVDVCCHSQYSPAPRSLNAITRPSPIARAQARAAAQPGNGRKKRSHRERTPPPILVQSKSTVGWSTRVASRTSLCRVSRHHYTL